MVTRRVALLLLAPTIDLPANAAVLQPSDSALLRLLLLRAQLGAMPLQVWRLHAGEPRLDLLASWKGSTTRVPVADAIIV